jgi:hypothetical protein
MFKRRPKTKAKPPVREPKPCRECGCPGVYGIDTFGVVSEEWRCRECHEKACRTVIREDIFTRYGVP